MNGLDIIPIFLASDEKYTPFLCTTMYSILEQTNSFIQFYILDGGIKSKDLIKQSLKIFKNYGYQCEYVQPVDMFCQTTGLECVAKLVKIV